MSEPPNRQAEALKHRYTLQRELGRGGMATVYLATDLQHERLVALKVLRPELAAVLGADRFLREIKTTAQLTHPHILPLLDSGDAEGTLFYVMPYVEGESLRDRLNREKQLPLDDALRLTREVAGALSYAHSQGVIHRDIKPVAECEERGLTYAVPIKAKLRLSQKAEDGKSFINTIEQDVYLGNLPTMTHRGTFIINGAERVVVSQLHRSPGVFFSESVHPNGTMMYSPRIIPFRGSWVEFSTDINNVMYAYIDLKKKFPVTTLLRALGYSSDDRILELFDLVEEIDVAKVTLKDYLGRTVCSDVFDKKTGEIFINKDSKLTEEHLKQIKKSDVKKIRLLKGEASAEG